MQPNPAPWAVIGAGPAGIASVGLLLDAGIAASDILWLDPEFQVGDFGQCWNEVHSNTSVRLFLEFLTDIQAFRYAERPQPFSLDQLPVDGFCALQHAAEPLQWITDHLRQRVRAKKTWVKELQVNNGCWQLTTHSETWLADKVILATGAEAKILTDNRAKTIPLATALKPSQLATTIDAQDCVAVFGSSHSAMIIIRNCLEAGAKHVINFYLSPIRYALPMDGYTLYDNSGLKGTTAQWTRENISKNLHPHVERYVSNEHEIRQHLPRCNKAVYAIGFKQRAPHLANIDLTRYDTSNGIIAPGLFGSGIGFPRQITDPNGNRELNVGLWKFMNDLRLMLPIWQRYGL
jgi:cation diffusion facilitator CzcD-associated flavoprotein CzcO